MGPGPGVLGPETILGTGEDVSVLSCLPTSRESEAWLLATGSPHPPAPRRGAESLPFGRGENDSVAE